MKELRAFLSQTYEMVQLYIYRKSYLHGDEDEFFHFFIANLQQMKAFLLVIVASFSMNLDNKNSNDTNF